MRQRVLMSNNCYYCLVPPAIATYYLTFCPSKSSSLEQSRSGISDQIIEHISIWS